MFGGIGFVNMLAFVWLISRFRPKEANTNDEVERTFEFESEPEEIQPLR